MATLQADDIVDLITITQRDLGKLRWTDLSYDLQEYIALPSILQKEKVSYGSGFGMQWNVMTGTSGATRDVGLYEVDSVNVADVMTTANVPWRHMTTNYAIERREIAMNTGAAQIVDLVKIRRHDAMVDLAKQPSPSYGTGARYGYYTNYDVIGPLEEVLEAQNDNLGNDIASKDGQLLFRQVPVTWCPFLEDRAGDPIYGINWGQFKPAFLSGEYLREEGPVKASNQHTVFQTHVDLTMNVMCTDRRANFVLATAQPDPTV
jgi:hypothetical protein